jgi:hypothetical protein
MKEKLRSFKMFLWDAQNEGRAEETTLVQIVHDVHETAINSVRRTKNPPVSRQEGTE